MPNPFLFYFCPDKCELMKLNKTVLLAFGLLILSASLYRAWPERPYGFAPQMAMALFSGAMIKNKKWAILLPLISMLVSDLIYQLLYINGVSTIQGFYAGQGLNYLLIAGVTLFGFLMKKISLIRVSLFSMTGSIIFFLASNFVVWQGGGGFGRPKTFEGLLLCYYDGLAFLRDYGVIRGFYGNLFIGDLFFCAIIFGTYYLLNKMVLQPKQQLV